MSKDLDRSIILSVQGADNHLLMIDELVREASEDTDSEELKRVYAEILKASEEAKAKLYGVRNEFRTLLRHSGLWNLSGAGERDH